MDFATTTIYSSATSEAIVADNSDEQRTKMKAKQVK